MSKTKKVILIVVSIIGFLFGFFICIFLTRTVTLFGTKYNVYSKKITIPTVNMENDKTWYLKLKDFNNLEEVDLGENHIYKEDFENIEKIYPKIKLKGVSKIKVYDLDILENVESLDLSSVIVDDKLGDYLGNLKKLKTVDLGDNKLDLDTQLSLSNKYSKIAFIWLVDVNGTYYKSDVEELNLGKEKIYDLEKLIKSLTLLKNLKKLEMEGSNLSNEQLGSLREAFSNIEINWRVKLGKWSLRTDAETFSVWITDYNYRRMNSKDIQVLKYCTKLKALDLGHQVIEDASIIGDYLPELRVLILADNRLKDINFISKLKKLHYLELFMNDITDLSPLNDLDGLVDVNISFNYHLKNIEPLFNKPKLERLWLVSDNISKEDYQRLRDAYPNAKVNNLGPGSTKQGWRTHPRYFELLKGFQTNKISDLFLELD